ncbi:MAG: 3'-5' exonuclease [Burkholderiales bacterium]|nr:3'-5' exonuclease [Burkholderiales bacterium]
MLPVLAFDIETVPDTLALRRLHALPDSVADAEVADMAFQRRRQAIGHDFLPLHQHRVVTIACALREREGFRIWSLGDADEGEGGLIQRFFDGIEKFTPQLVSWNGGGFDLPVLHYRAMLHGVRAKRYWELGDEDREFRYNNYISRYHTRHIDLMDLLGLYQSRIPLDEFAQMLGLPGKVGMHGSQVWDAFRAGRVDAIRSYCEADVANTYLVYLRFEYMRGVLSAQAYANECRLARETIARLPGAHWKTFLDGWNDG